MSIQYTVQGFEPMTFSTSHPITTRTGLPPYVIFVYEDIKDLILKNLRQRTNLL